MGMLLDADKVCDLVTRLIDDGVSMEQKKKDGKKTANWRRTQKLEMMGDERRRD